MFFKVRRSRPVFDPVSQMTSFTFNNRSKGHCFMVFNIAAKNAILAEGTALRHVEVFLFIF